MSRIIDSIGLFGVDNGGGTNGSITCGICKTEYNYENQGDDVRHVSFAGVTVCNCCFEVVEDSVLYHMPDIIRWYQIILDMRQRKIDGARALLAGYPADSRANGEKE